MGRYEEAMKKVDILVWQTKLRKFIPGLADDPPTYGKVVDDLRYKYGIYITVYPVTEQEKDDQRRIILRYTGRTLKTEGRREIVKEELVSGNTYESVMRDCIDIAIRFLEEG